MDPNTAPLAVWVPGSPTDLDSGLMVLVRASPRGEPHVTGIGARASFFGYRF
jgi:hypothetical protein